MVINMKVNLMMIKLKVLDYLEKMMVVIMMENGKIIYNMDMVQKNGVMVMYMKVGIRME